MEAKMFLTIDHLLATFTAPEFIGTDPQSLLWILPLAMLGTIIYKAMKLPKITTMNFIKEVAILFTFLIALMIVIILALFVITWMIGH